MKEKIGASFPKSFKIAGFIAIIIGILIISLNIFVNEVGIIRIIIAIVLIVAGFIINFSFYGIEIDKENLKYKEYSNILGITFGKCKEISDYSYVSIVKSEHGFRIYAFSTVSISASDKKYDVCFFNRTYRKKVLIKICNTEENATRYAKKLSKETGLEHTKYSPKISKSTIDRHSKRK
jgi:hypothetical protein